MNSIKPILIVVAVIFSLGGAVNSGWSSFYLAVPFMGYLIYQSYKKSILILSLSVLFVIVCIVTSKTLVKNPLIFPVLRGGEVTVVRDGFQRTFYDGSGGFIPFEELTVNEPSESQKKIFDDFVTNSEQKSLTYFDSFNITVTKIKKGDIYKVTAVYHQTADFTDNISVVTEIGRFRLEDFRPESSRYSVDINKQIQTSWSKYLGNLMYWPIFPIVALTAFNK
jgi:hypothetical protein